MENGDDVGSQVLLRSKVRQCQATSPKMRCKGARVNGRGFRGAMEQVVNQQNQENQAQ